MEADSRSPVRALRTPIRWLATSSPTWTAAATEAIKYVVADQNGQTSTSTPTVMVQDAPYSSST